MAKSKKHSPKRMHRDEKLMQRFLDPMHLLYLRKQILSSGARVDSCIWSIRVLIEITRAKWSRIKISPLTVELFVFNKIFADWIRENGFEIPPSVGVRLGAMGGRYLVIGDREHIPEEGKWPGHLVAIARTTTGEDYLIDLSIDQAHRPQKGISLREPLAFKITKPNFLQGKAIETGNVNDCLLVYAPHLEDKSYETTPDWTKHYELLIGNDDPMGFLP